MIFLAQGAGDRRLLLQRRVDLLYRGKGLLDLSLLGKFLLFLLVDVFKRDNELIPPEIRLYQLALEILYQIVAKDPVIEITGLLSASSVFTSSTVRTRSNRCRSSSSTSFSI